MDAPIPVDEKAAIATLRYRGTAVNSPPIVTHIPPLNATDVEFSFLDSLRSLNSKKYPAKVPLHIDHSLFFYMAIGINSCATCLNGTQFVADINNVSFVMPTTALLQAHYYNISGVFTDDFPERPLMPFDYTGNPPSNLQTMSGTKVYRVSYNSTVQVVLQGTVFISPENHPAHLHGFNFFEVGRGEGNFDPEKDPKKFNLVDPIERNTIAVPSGGWTAIRFRADNPGKPPNWSVHSFLNYLRKLPFSTIKLFFSVVKSIYLFGSIGFPITTITLIAFLNRFYRKRVDRMKTHCTRVLLAPLIVIIGC